MRIRLRSVSLFFTRIYNTSIWYPKGQNGPLKWPLVLVLQVMLSLKKSGIYLCTFLCTSNPGWCGNPSFLCVFSFRHLVRAPDGPPLLMKQTPSGVFFINAVESVVRGENPKGRDRRSTVRRTVEQGAGQGDRTGSRRPASCGADREAPDGPPVLRPRREIFGVLLYPENP